LLRKQRERQEKRAREQQQTRAAMRAAWEATRAAAAGKSRAQIRESYVAELLARAVTVPSGLVLDAVADAIARNRDKISVVYGAVSWPNWGWTSGRRWRPSPNHERWRKARWALLVAPTPGPGGVRRAGILSSRTGRPKGR